jgi:hypothetical protein
MFTFELIQPDVCIPPPPRDLDFGPDFVQAAEHPPLADLERADDEVCFTHRSPSLARSRLLHSHVEEVLDAANRHEPKAKDVARHEVP